MIWRRLQAEGCDWEVRAVGMGPEEEFLEFRCPDGNHPPRRVAIMPGALAAMNETELRSAFQHALPIGGDHYGRPGKVMSDITGL